MGTREQFQKDLQGTFQTLQILCNEIGYPETKQEVLFNQLFRDLHQTLQLFTSRVTEDKLELERKIHSVKTLVFQMIASLSLPLIEGSGGSLTEQLCFWQKQQEQLQTEYDLKLLKAKNLQEKLYKLWESLGEPSKGKTFDEFSNFSDVSCDLSEDRLREFELQIEKALLLREERQKKAQQLLSDIEDLTFQLGELPAAFCGDQLDASSLAADTSARLSETSWLTGSCAQVSSSPLCEGKDSICSLTTLDKLSLRKQQLEAVKRQRIEQVKSLLASLSLLTDLLSEKPISVSPQLYCHSDTLALLTKEEKRLKEEKKKRALVLISSQKQKLEALWEQLQYSVQQRNLFENRLAPLQDKLCASSLPLADNSLLLDKILKSYEEEIQHLEKIFESYKPLLEDIRKRECYREYKKKLKELEAQPSRLLSRVPNRGKERSKEEKMRAKVARLPSLNSSLKTALVEWEKKTNSHFYFDGKRYLDTMDAQHSRDREERKLAKLARDRARAEQLTHSSNGKTPRGRSRAPASAKKPSATSASSSTAVPATPSRSRARTPDTSSTTRRASLTDSRRSKSVKVSSARARSPVHTPVHSRHVGKTASKTPSKTPDPSRILRSTTKITNSTPPSLKKAKIQFHS